MLSQEFSFCCIPCEWEALFLLVRHVCVSTCCSPSFFKQATKVLHQTVFLFEVLIYKICENGALLFVPITRISKSWSWIGDRLKLLFSRNKFPADKVFMSIGKIKVCTLNHNINYTST